MGRRREFDKEEALRLIERRFWQAGYQATSVQDLAEVTGVKPGSLFKCFGVKKDLYLSALERYAEQDSPRAALLKLFDTPLLTALDQLYSEIIDRVENNAPLPDGCLVSNHVAELNSVEDDVSEPSIGLMNSTKDTLKLRLKWAQEQGELEENADVDAITSHLFCVLQGLCVMSVSTRKIDEMRQAKDLALSVVRPHIRNGGE